MRYSFKTRHHFIKQPKLQPSFTGPKNNSPPIATWTRLRLLLIAGILILASCFSISESSFATSCDDVKFVFARGSGESLGDVSFTAWRSSIENILKPSNLKTDFYELGSASWGGYSYPAVSVGGSLSGFGNLLGAYISKGSSFDFGNSVVSGINELRFYMYNVIITCPQTKFVLGGYSQGAMVLSGTLDALDSERILYVATFGDPKIYLPEGKGIIPPACLGRGYSDYRTYVPDCLAYKGILGSYEPYQPKGYENKLGTWCNSKDLMCSSGSSLSDHTAYTSEGLYAHAAREIKKRLKSAFPRAFNQNTSTAWANSSHDVAILFDTTGSMEFHIARYRTYAEDLSHQVKENGGRVAVAEYRDLGDPHQPQILCDFNCSETEVKDQIASLKTGSGGDEPESALSGLLYTMNNLDWQTGAAKSIVLITDNTYLSPDRDGTTLSAVIQRSLEIDPVNIYVMTTDKYLDSYIELTTATGGKAFSVDVEADRIGLAQNLLWRPEALLATSEYYGCVGDKFRFDASASHSSNDDSLHFDWDLDGDGKFEIINGTPIIEQTYSAAFTGFIQVRVTDSSNYSSTMSAKIEVVSTLPQLPKITNVQPVETAPGIYRVQYQTTNTELTFLSIDDTPIGYFDGSVTSFTLKDIDNVTTLRLIPYNSDVGRGESIELIIDPDSPPTPAITMDTKGNLAAKSNLPAIIPKAPNAGTATL